MVIVCFIRLISFTRQIIPIGIIDLGQINSVHLQPQAQFHFHGLLAEYTYELKSTSCHKLNNFLFFFYHWTNAGINVIYAVKDKLNEFAS